MLLINANLPKNLLYKLKNQTNKVLTIIKRNSAIAQKDGKCNSAIAQKDGTKCNSGK